MLIELRIFVETVSCGDGSFSASYRLSRPYIPPIGSVMELPGLPDGWCDGIWSGVVKELLICRDGSVEVIVGDEHGQEIIDIGGMESTAKNELEKSGWTIGV